MRSLIGRLLCAWLCVVGLGGRATAQPPNAPRETAADAASRALLDALEERQMPDVTLTVLARIEADPDASQELKREAAFRRAGALVGTSRLEADSGKRAKILDEAQASLDAFLTSGTPTDRQAIAAYNQKGSLLVERGRVKADQATRPGADAATLRAEAVKFFDAAIASLAGKAKPDATSQAVTNAEDAVLKVLRELDARINALKPAEKTEGDAADGKGKDTAKDDEKSKDAKEKERKEKLRQAKPIRLTAAQQRELEALEEEREVLRAKLIQTRLTAAAAVFEKAKAYPENSKERTETLATSAALFKAIADKYPTKGGGLFARYYEGRNYAMLGQWQQAMESVAPLTELDQRVPLAIRLRSMSANTLLQSLLGEMDELGKLPADKLNPRYEKEFPGGKAADAAAKVAALRKKELDKLDESLRRFALEDVSRLPGARLDADWLGLKYRTAKLVLAQADALDTRDPQARVERTRMQAEARKLAVEVARAGAEFADEARALAAELGKEVAAGEQTFADVMDAAKESLATMQNKVGEAKAAAAAKDAANEAAARQEATAARDATVAKFREALALAGIADPLSAAPADDALADGVTIDDVNQARYFLTFLFYEGGKFAEAGTLGRMLTERYPNAKGSRQAARIAMAAWQQVAQRADGEAARQARAGAAELAGIVMKTWPDEPESGDAAVIALSTAAAAQDPAAIISIVQQVSPASPKRPELLLRAGVSLWPEVQKARRLPDGDRPDDATIDGWKRAATQALDEGLAALGDSPTLPGPPLGQLAAPAALSRVQIAMEDNDDQRAAALLQHPGYGPWTLVAGDNPVMQQGPLAEAALTLALRLFIQTEDFDKAQQAMAGLEKVAGQGEQASAKLSAMYLAMGRDLQAQLEALGSGANASSPEVRQQAEKILTGFEKFLDGVATRDSKTSSQIWVATTYLTLGSGKGTGAIVPAAKKSAYLKKAAEVYQKLLAAKDNPDLARFEPSIRLRMAAIYQELGDWDNAQGQIDWILSDSQRQNSLEVQITAAEILQAAGLAAAAAGDAAKANDLLREAASGRKGTPAVIWGWGNIANRLARQGLSGTDSKAQQNRDAFFEARLRVVEGLLARARLPGKEEDRSKRLETANTAIVMTRKLYPDLGGDAFAKRYERLLKDVQREQGAEPTGFSALDAQPAAAAPAAVPSTP